MKVVFLQRIRRIVAAGLMLAMMLGVVYQQLDYIFAYEAQPGMIYSADRALVLTRKEATDDSDRVSSLEYGKPVTVIDEVTDEEGVLWYQITYTLKSNGASKTGYCRAENVLLDKDAKAYAFGTINTTNVAFRNDAGTDGTQILFYLNTGAELEMLDQTTVSSKTWYRVRYNDGTTTTIGWVYGSYITLERYNVEIDPAYVEELIAKGFPESYTYNLAVLHALYPEWIFEPVMTGLDWNTVIEKETEKPINMVPTSADDAKKSVDDSEYDWTTNTWVIRDGDSWVAVHPEYLAYVMDPRNFLTETYIFQFESLSFNESHNIEGVQAVIGSSFMKNDVVDTDGTTLNYAKAFMEIGKQVGVSPYHLAARVRQEQGSGKSSLISGTYSGYEGYFNYFNFGAYGVTDAAVIKAGLTYAKNQGWDSRYKSLLGGSQMIAKNYIARGQDTLYFQKYNVVWKDMLYGHQYMGNVDAAASEGKNMASAYEDKHQSFVFRIPVYENMPEKAVQFTTTGNRNNYLKDITVEGLSLSPTFTGANKEYTLTVANSISSINVSAQPVVSTSTVTGTGVFSLAVGENIIKIICESESGDERIYTLTIVREGMIEPEEPGDSETPTETEGPTETENPSDSETPTESENPDDEPTTEEPTTGKPSDSETPTEPENPDDEPTTEEPSSSETPTYTYTELNQTMYVISGVNVRDLPAKDGNSLGILSANQKVTVTGQCNETGWYRIVFESKVGYVSDKYLTLENPKPETPPSITSEIYTFGTYVTGIQPGTTVEDFLNGITCNGGAEVKLLDKNGTQKTGIVGTGNLLSVYGNGELVASYDLVVYGDVSGDGKVNTLDAIKLNRYTIGLATLSRAYLEAADASRDSRVNTLDSIVINRFSIGLATIKQN